jgi:hypothetical protein
MIAGERDPNSHRVSLAALQASITLELADQAKDKLWLLRHAGTTVL